MLVYNLSKPDQHSLRICPCSKENSSSAKFLKSFFSCDTSKRGTEYFFTISKVKRRAFSLFFHPGKKKARLKKGIGVEQSKLWLGPPFVFLPRKDYL